MPRRSHLLTPPLPALDTKYLRFPTWGSRKQPRLQRLDNEESKALQHLLQDRGIDYQLASPIVHRRNSTERDIRTFENHPDFPLHLWDRLLPQTLITLNLPRASCINPRLSAQAQLLGAFDFNRTPLAPVGKRVMIQ
jgi:hypothetical protein